MDHASDIAFSPAVKAVQSARGSRAAYRRMEEGAGWPAEVTPDLAAFIAAQTSVFLGTASAEGQPYIQHRGGPPGFLKVVDAQTIGWAELRGNRQYITTGNIAENPRATLFLIDYAQRRRIKLWGRLRAVTDDATLAQSLLPPGSGAKAEQALLFTLLAWDANCPQHIPQRFEAADVAAALAQRDARIAALEAEVTRLTSGQA